jgi:hypothetical protein
MKENALYEVVGENDVPRNRNILKDEMIELRGLKAFEMCPYPLRKIEVYDPETGEVLVSLSNNLKLGATTIAAISKERWPVEILFKALKQNLKIKTFVGTSANAVKIQIWTAGTKAVIAKPLIVPISKKAQRCKEWFRDLNRDACQSKTKTTHGGSWRLVLTYQKALVSRVQDICVREGIEFRHCKHDVATRK